MRTISRCIAIIGLCVVAAAANAQSVQKQVLANGATLASAQGLTVRGTIGQTVIGRAGTANLVVNEGFWVEEATMTTSTSEFDEDSFVLTLEPNPAREHIRLRYTLEKSTSVAIEIMDMRGRSIYTQPHTQMPAGEHLCSIVVGDLPRGTYICYLRTEFAIRALRLIVH